MMERKNVKRLVKHRPLYRIVKASQRIHPPGCGGLSLYLVTKFFIRGIIDGTLNMRASALSFSFFLALFPSIIFLFTLIPYIPIENFQDYLFNLLQKVMPEAAFAATEGTIADIIGNQRGGLLSIGFVTALYFSTNGFNAMINAFNESYHDIETRNALKQRIASFYMLILTVLLISASIVLLIFGEFGMNKFEDNKVLFYLLSFLKWLVLGALCYSIISFNYYLGPKRKKGWHFFSPGCTLASILIILATIIFTYYVNNFGNYNKLYGSIGTLIVILMLIYINSLILLLGFDLNASIQIAQKHRASFSRYAK